jgi:drug/metabolite transporter (DMT)-like permease
MGLVYVGLAIVGWGVGDFLIQRSARKLGDWEALFFVTLFATIVLFPFVYAALSALSGFEWLVLSLTSVIILVAALFDFEALRIGKISIIEPIYAMEVPITIALSTLLIGEVMTSTQLALIAILLLGIVLVSNKSFGTMRIKSIERGVIAAVLATIGLGISNFLFGFASRETSPIMINWFTSAFMAVASIAYLLWVGEGKRTMRNLWKNKTLILSVGFVDNMAWVAYATSMLTLPIGFATGLSESYIALGALLGVAINKERLSTHQVFGLIIALCAAVALALTMT